MTLNDELLLKQVERFYERVRADEVLAPIFAKHVRDWTAHTERLSDFWSAIMLTSGRYKGNPYAAHLPFADQLTPELFQHWLDLWSETARENFSDEVATQLETKARRVARSLMAGLLFRPDQSVSLKEALGVQPGQH